MFLFLFLLKQSETNPAPIFDLSACRLSELPSGVYSKCKVFRKDKLVLCNNLFTKLPNNVNNQLSELKELRYLDLNHNRLTKLTSKISFLVNLEELHLNDNKLKSLPESLALLKKLRTINISDNCLDCFPFVFTRCKNLMCINVKHNAKIKQLPVELIKLNKLQSLLIDSDNIEYPNKDVTSKGLSTTVDDLSGYLVEDDASEEEITKPKCNKDESDDDDYDEQGKHEEEKKKQLIECEKRLLNDMKAQQNLSSAYEMKKKLLLNELYSEQVNIAKDLADLQVKKIQHKSSLIKKLTVLEQHSKKLIESISKWENRRQQQQSILDEIEETEKRILSRHNSMPLKKNAILKAMQSSLSEERRDNQYSPDLELLMRSKVANQELVRERLSREHELQRGAFELLQRERDEQHQMISNQIRLVENELLALTQAEMQRKSFNLEAMMTSVSEHRSCLAMVLAQLLDEKEQRECFIHNVVEALEEKRHDLPDSNQSEDFWLIQYQRLMTEESVENQLQTLNISDENVKQVLIRCDKPIVPYLHIFVDQNLSFSQLLEMSEKDFLTIGIDDFNVAELIKDAIEEVRESICPSAPPYSVSDEDEPSPSAPPLTKFWFQIECVICLSAEVSILCFALKY
ncbi:E3 ubiquitin-protein ligase LRSAM1-like protein [Leptotrombidium deliense]|uniref:E3 ubiquitin-protein ligase LRSAM1-like protein n=1 Tax=Leptotrombidium deliense TaxID=299467 RepID=A0A443SQ06_9ACAR|nr:E3 ubiquitin-protein ligase LRSAM1-like protein [Leptotrombidium deliense]